MFIKYLGITYPVIARINYGGSRYALVPRGSSALNVIKEKMTEVVFRTPEFDRLLAHPGNEKQIVGHEWVSERSNMLIMPQDNQDCMTLLQVYEEEVNTSCLSALKNR